MKIEKKIEYNFSIHVLDIIMRNINKILPGNQRNYI